MIGDYTITSMIIACPVILLIYQEIYIGKLTNVLMHLLKGGLFFFFLMNKRRALLSKDFVAFNDPLANVSLLLSLDAVGTLYVQNICNLPVV